MASRLYRLKDVSWRLPGDEPWRIPSDKPWQISDTPRSAVATLVDAPADVPSALFVPSMRPPALEPIDGAGLIRGLAVPWSTPTEIRSKAEGHFYEEFSPGSFTRSLAKPGVKLSALFNHGLDSALGFRPLGAIQAWESSRGLEFEIATLPVEYAQDVLKGVEAGVYGGASVRFGTVRDKVRRNPGRSSFNPRGIEHRVIQEAALREISVVVWPAYSGTSVAA